MLNQDEINMMKKMDFNDLKKELTNSKNSPVRDLVIRKIMKQKYLLHKKNNKKKTLDKESNDNGVEEIYKKEIQKDYINNGLLERLNSDLYIRKKSNSVKNKKDFVPPFADDAGDNFAPFGDKSTKDDFLSTVKDFSNKKFL